LRSIGGVGDEDVEDGGVGDEDVEDGDVGDEDVEDDGVGAVCCSVSTDFDRTSLAKPQPRPILTVVVGCGEGEEGGVVVVD